MCMQRAGDVGTVGVNKSTVRAWERAISKVPRRLIRCRTRVRCWVGESRSRGLQTVSLQLALMSEESLGGRPELKLLRVARIHLHRWRTKEQYDRASWCAPYCDQGNNRYSCTPSLGMSIPVMLLYGLRTAYVTRRGG